MSATSDDLQGQVRQIREFITAAAEMGIACARSHAPEHAAFHRARGERLLREAEERIRDLSTAAGDCTEVVQVAALAHAARVQLTSVAFTHRIDMEAARRSPLH